MGNFSGIGGVDTFERGTYLSPDGNFVLAVQKMLVKETRKSGDGFIVEFKVVESDHPKHSVGSRVTWFQGMRDKDIAMPAIKEFMIALMHIDMSDASEKEEFNSTLEDLLDEATSHSGSDAEHPLYDQKIRCKTYLKLTQRNTDFTVHNWDVYSEDIAA